MLDTQSVGGCVVPTTLYALEKEKSLAVKGIVLIHPVAKAVYG